MRRLILVAAILASGGIAFAQETSVPTTETEAITMLIQQTETLRLTAEDSAAAGDAFRAMVQAGVQVRNAYRITSDALDNGLKARELTMIAERVRLRRSLGLSAQECEETARAMIQEQIRIRTQTAAGTATQKQTQDRPAEPSEAPSSRGK
ncbi:MAG: hypothetical protein CVV47_07830 [Spirochaetae bacterium HGW-Spirochaetae-3]|jgi:hypothetical protein|nr:MAG: hypothetical protein CVV47_07830 [Spirochaetae bacterium HGW-Spirochaetae-3]